MTDGTSQSSQGQGNQSAQGSAQGQTSGGASGQATSSAASSSASSQSAQTRPDWAPESAWDAKTGLNHEAFGKHFAEKINPILTRDAAEQVRRNTLPQSADKYEVKTSEAFKPPAGVEFKLDTNDPLWGQARAWAHKNGLSQEAFMEAIDLVAGRDVGTAQRVQTARTAEIAKLGTTGPARVDAVETFYRGLLGSEAAAKAMMSRVFTAADVELHEKIISKFATQGHASFSAAHREPGDAAGRVDDATYAKMTPGEKFTYARQFSQNGQGAAR